MASELGKAYVQIIPSAKGIGGAIEKELGPEAEAAGKSSGSRLTSALKGAITVAAIGKFFAESIKEGATLQQSLGGVETLFKDHADKVKANANEAYRTSGLSANAYMENVTSFSASLLQSVAGDTSKAADIADMAMVDMSDNANKFGTNMQDIQNAYQGFAKQNYTMLDNLKLGYGGTKTEMERLLKDAQAFSGVEYNIENLSDVYEAIHVIQEEMGVAGTTAIEASETFSGSFAAMKSAFKNTLGSLALGENIGPSLKGLAETVSTFLFGNFIPMVVNIVKSIIPAVAELIVTGAPQLLESGMAMLQSLSDGVTTGIPALLETIQSIVTGISTWLRESFPDILQQGVDLIVNFATGIMNSAPSVLDNIGSILETVLSAIMDIIPTISKSGYDLIAGFATGILQNLPGQIASVGDSLNSNFQTILDAVFQILSDAMPEMLDKGFEMLSKLVQGVAKNIPAVVRAILEVVTKLITTLAQNLPKFLEKGVELIERLARGVSQNLPTIVSTIGTVLQKVILEIVRHLPQILQKGVELIGKLAAGLLQAIPRVLSAAGQILRSLISSIGSFVGQMVSAGYNLLMGLAQGISNAVGRVIGRAIEAAKGVVSAVKNFFGIRSPSRVFMEIGGFLDAGLAEGISGNAGVVSKAMDDITQMTTGTLESDLNLSTAIPKAMQDLTADIDVNANKQSAHLTFVLGGHRFKAFVDDITKLQDRDTELELAY